MEKITGEKKVSELGTNLDILMDFQTFGDPFVHGELVCFIGDFIANNTFAETGHGIYISP